MVILLSFNPLIFRSLLFVSLFCTACLGRQGKNGNDKPGDTFAGINLMTTKFFTCVIFVTLFFCMGFIPNTGIEVKFPPRAKHSPIPRRFILLRILEFNGVKLAELFPQSSYGCLNKNQP